MAAKAPSEAGKVIVSVRGKRSGPILGGLMLAIIAAMPAFDRKLWPVSLAILGMAVLIGALAWVARRYFVHRLIAVGERGLVVSKGGHARVVPWSAVKGLTWGVRRGTRYYSIQCDGTIIGFVPQDLRGDTGRRILDALATYARVKVAR